MKEKHIVIFFIVIVVLSIISTIWIINSDLPIWVKVLLLRN